MGEVVTVGDWRQLIPLNQTSLSSNYPLPIEHIAMLAIVASTTMTDITTMIGLMSHPAYSALRLNVGTMNSTILNSPSVSRLLGPRTIRSRVNANTARTMHASGRLRRGRTLFFRRAGQYYPSADCCPGCDWCPCASHRETVDGCPRHRNDWYLLPGSQQVDPSIAGSKGHAGGSEEQADSRR